MKRQEFIKHKAKVITLIQVLQEAVDKCEEMIDEEFEKFGNDKVIPIVDLLEKGMRE